MRLRHNAILKKILIITLCRQRAYGTLRSVRDSLFTLLKKSIVEGEAMRERESLNKKPMGNEWGEMRLR